MHIYRWDLDKTYLETDIHSLRGLVRSATEPARAKRAVPGAPALIRALNSQDNARIFILSGSPEQLRPVLEEKLRLDGVRVDGLTLKDNLKNIRKGRFRDLLGQFGYKLPALLLARESLGAGVKETLFGDDSEVDALVYSVYADAVSRRITPAQVSRIMEAAGSYPDSIEGALGALSRVSTADAVESIFIRVERGSPPKRFQPLSQRVIPVYSWWQAALVLFDRKRLSEAMLLDVMHGVMTGASRSTWAMAALSQDIVRRGFVSPGVFSDFNRDSSVIEACRKALVCLPTPKVNEVGPLSIDYLELVRHWSS